VKRTGEGLYIVVEGCEYSGKSTLARRLAEDYSAVLTRETGGTAVGRLLRAILHDMTLDMISPRTESFITAADRAQHIHEIVAPNLAEGRMVISDRSWVSSLVYQAHAGGVEVDDLMTITEIAIGEFMNADQLLVLQVPFEVFLARQQERGITDRFEAKELDFHRKVLEGYETVARDLGAVVIDATKSKEQVHAEASKHVDNLVNERNE